ncbi:hypothetical protein [Methylocaldum sp.]|uniref:hypothetical protein n=1 Tax=Methylocaldum sp. TaxID=1969727 RepID=UPI002D6637FA|nr:hypothetical protein [Methylocaldum sp.]HYE38134.1 hypothetical protein [Methylocaldum sp.]
MSNGTPEQKAAAKLALAELFGDLLTPPPKGKPGRPKKTASGDGEPKVFKPRAFPTSPQTSPFFEATSREYFIVEQHCLSCGSFTRYAETKMLRYKAVKRKDGLAIEIPCCLPAPLDVPSLVTYRSESTDFCAHCVEITSRLDSSTLFELSNPNTALQLKLFN